MLAILVVIGTIYACNFSFLTQDDHFHGVLKIFEIAGIYAPNEIVIAGIIGPPDIFPLYIQAKNPN